MSSMCLPAVALRSHSWRRCHSPTLLSMNDCGSFCHASTIVYRSFQFVNWDETLTMVDHLLKGTLRWHNQAGSNPSYSVAICLAQWTACSLAVRNAVRYYRNHSLDGATLFFKLDSNKLRFNVKNEMSLICAKFDADLINISKAISRKTMWPRFFGPPGIRPVFEWPEGLKRKRCRSVMG